MAFRRNSEPLNTILAVPQAAAIPGVANNIQTAKKTAPPASLSPKPEMIDADYLTLLDEQNPTSGTLDDHSTIQIMTPLDRDYKPLEIGIINRNGVSADWSRKNSVVTINTTNDGQLGDPSVTEYIYRNDDGYHLTMHSTMVDNISNHRKINPAEDAAPDVNQTIQAEQQYDKNGKLIESSITSTDTGGSQAYSSTRSITQKYSDGFLKNTEMHIQSKHTDAGVTFSNTVDTTPTHDVGIWDAKLNPDYLTDSHTEKYSAYSDGLDVNGAMHEINNIHRNGDGTFINTTSKTIKSDGKDIPIESRTIVSADAAGTEIISGTKTAYNPDGSKKSVSVYDPTTKEWQVQGAKPSVQPSVKPAASAAASGAAPGM